MLNAESARIEVPRGVGFLGGGVPLPTVPSRLGDLWERRKLPQPTHSRHISGPQNPSSRNNALRNQSKIWRPGQDLGGLCRPGPSLKPPPRLSRSIQGRPKTAHGFHCNNCVLSQPIFTIFGTCVHCGKFSSVFNAVCVPCKILIATLFMFTSKT